MKKGTVNEFLRFLAVWKVQALSDLEQADSDFVPILVELLFGIDLSERAKVVRLKEERFKQCMQGGLGKVIVGNVGFPEGISAFLFRLDKEQVFQSKDFSCRWRFMTVGVAELKKETLFCVILWSSRDRNYVPLSARSTLGCVIDDETLKDSDMECSKDEMSHKVMSIGLKMVRGLFN